MFKIQRKLFCTATHFTLYSTIFHLLCCYTTIANTSGTSTLSRTTTLPPEEKVIDRPCGFLLGANSAHLTTPEIINIYGLEVETHTIITEDGYILETHRIPSPGQPAILILHGLMMSSRGFLLNCDRRAIAVRFADEKFDVWLINYRGTVYSQGHRQFRNTKRRYWRFSFDEVGYYDVSANIDYILKTTGLKKISWVGYSMGNAVMFSLLSVRPEYNEKIHLGFTLGAAAGLGHSRNLALSSLAPYHRIIDSIVTTLHHGEVLPRSLIPIFHEIMPKLCAAEVQRAGAGICTLLQIGMDGYDGGQVDTRVFQALLGGFPQPVSVRMLSQLLQWIYRDKFAHYDFGPLGNLRKYGDINPPDYDIGRVTAPTVFFWAENDHLTSPYDVKRSISQVSNIYRVIKLNSTLWNHIDFGFGKDADIYIYNEMIQILKDSFDGAARSNHLFR